VSEGAGRRFVAQGRNTPFVCVACGFEVPALAQGSCRNHCPRCLTSLHVDVMPGDRASDCGGVLEAVAVEHSGKKGWIIVHRCRRCGELRRNRAALEDPECPDDLSRLIELMGEGATPRP
jgi:DNA-directed RNA polymerase subunit RPC12/RpoP